jgi:hypothetical protein
MNKMKKLTLIGALLISGSANAQQICDFEHKCYSGLPPPQIYHDLNGNEIPPPAPQYPPRSVTVHAPSTPQVTINAGVCKLAKIRIAPEAPQTIVEICTISDEEERMYRQRQSQLEASIPRFQPY